MDPFLETLGPSYSQEQAHELATHLYDLYSTPVPFTVFPDARRFLSNIQPLRGQDLKLGVITNFDRRIVSIAEQLNLSRQFDFITYSEAARSSKPEPEIFLHALRESGLNEEEIGGGERVLHVGDDVEKDYLGAKSQGWNALLLDREGQGVPSVVEQEDVARDFDEVWRRLSSAR